MLKTITKFVVERRRLVRQGRQQVIEEGDSGDPAGHSEVPQREGDNGDPSRHSEVQQHEGDNSESPKHSNVPPQLAEPQLGEPPAPTVWGKVKWFNASKGYGFVQLSDGSGDVFIHATALAGIGVSTLQRGETLELRVALGQRGPQVTEVISVDSSTAAPSRPPRKILRFYNPGRCARRAGLI
jgi:cold shock CspA family protein